MLKEVLVPERGTTSIDRATWTELQMRPEIWDLVDRRLITVSAQRGGSAKLTGGSSVGIAKCGTILLRINEKVPGALEALLTGRSSRVRTVGLPGITSSDMWMFDRIVASFLECLRRYVASGREWEYRLLRQRGSIAGGRILELETALLRRSGFPNQLVFEKKRISYDTEVNSCLAAALLAVEAYGSAELLPESAIAESRALAGFFYENFTTNVLVSHPEQVAFRSRDLAEAKSGNTRELLEAASLVLAGGGLSTVASLSTEISLTWFFNLEWAFETAIREGLQNTAPDCITVSKGTEEGYLFPSARRLKVDPDLIVSCTDSGKVIAVGDVKYKNIDGDPSAADVYQLLAHASALGAKKAFLVYPAAKGFVRRWGLSAAGVDLMLFGCHPGNADWVAAEVFKMVTRADGKREE